MSDKYQTDKWVLDLVCDENTWDPCPINWNRDLHACSLVIEWDSADNIFINPPYSNPLPWVQKAIETNHNYGTRIVMLLKHDTSTTWYKLLHQADAKILMFGSRLKHRTRKGAAFPQILAVLP